MDQLDELRAFEVELDAALASRPLLRSADSARAVVDCVGTVNLALSNPETRGLGMLLQLGLQVALPELYRRVGDEAVDPAVIASDLVFMGHYYYIRELLYYTYNAPDTFEWAFSTSSVEVRFKDPSIRAQFALSMNTAVATSLEGIERRKEISAELHSLLRGAEELGAGEHIERALDLIASEVDVRLAAKFEMFGGKDSVVQLPEYSYAALYEAVHYLLMKVLYHRYYAQANSIEPCFRFRRDELIRETAWNSGVDATLVARIIGDLSYSDANKSLPPMYFGLIESPDHAEILIAPDAFVDCDYFTQVLRVQAKRSPDWFLGNLSGRLGDRFNEVVAAQLEGAGFAVKRNVVLAGIDPTVPDIDIQAISPEPTLGYYVFLCEAKGSIPGLWAKDHLRVLHPNSIPKAFAQVEKIVALLDSDDGREFFVDLVQASVDTSVPEGVIVGRAIIVTSQNNGMFFSGDGYRATIIDYHTFAHLLRRCDGDVLYLLHAFKEAPERFGKTGLAICEFTVGDRQVRYETQAFDSGSFVPFREDHVWRSDGSDVRAGKEFFESGGSPFDVMKYWETKRE